MSTKVEKCMRCHRRFRGHGEWNHKWISGLLVGAICPDCQTMDEDLEAELSEITGASANWTFIPPPPTAAMTRLDI